MDHQEKVRAVDDFARRLTRDKIRLAVGTEDGRHSFVWAAWSQGSEYYLGVNSMLGNIRISLHQSGICRFALTSNHYDELPRRGLIQPPDRALTKWKRKPTPEAGATHVMSLIFPSDHLRLAAPEATIKKPVLILPAPPNGFSLQIGFFYSRQRMAELEDDFLRIGAPMFHSELRNGDVVIMACKQIPYKREMLPRGDELIARYLYDPISTKPDGEKIENAVAHFWNCPEAGEQFCLWEVGGVTLERSRQPAQLGKIDAPG